MSLLNKYLKQLFEGPCKGVSSSGDYWAGIKLMNTNANTNRELGKQLQVIYLPKKCNRWLKGGTRQVLGLDLNKEGLRTKKICREIRGWVDPWQSSRVSGRLTGLIGKMRWSRAGVRSDKTTRNKETKVSGRKEQQSERQEQKLDDGVWVQQH